MWQASRHYPSKAALACQTHPLSIHASVLFLNNFVPLSTGPICVGDDFSRSSGQRNMGSSSVAARLFSVFFWRNWMQIIQLLQPHHCSLVTDVSKRCRGKVHISSAVSRMRATADSFGFSAHMKTKNPRVAGVYQLANFSISWVCHHFPKVSLCRPRQRWQKEFANQFCLHEANWNIVKSTDRKRRNAEVPRTLHGAHRLSVFTQDIELPSHVPETKPQNNGAQQTKTIKTFVYNTAAKRESWLLFDCESCRSPSV